MFAFVAPNVPLVFAGSIAATRPWAHFDQSEFDGRFVGAPMGTLEATAVDA